ncbi:MAG: PadR family transcriptional regulator [Promethearchaeota archaeon]
MRDLFKPTRIIHSIILSRIILHGPLHGYALANAIEDHLGWKPSQTAIYNTLKTLEKEKAVSAEDKIEKGRVRKIYAITETGKTAFLDARENMKCQMGEKFAQLLTLMQNFTDFDNNQNIKAWKETHGSVNKDMDLISTYFVRLLKVAPEEVHQILTNTTSALKDLADKHNIIGEQSGNIKNG